MEGTKAGLTKRIGNHCFTTIRSPLTWLLMALCVFCLFHFSETSTRNIMLWRCMATSPEPEQCALCAEDSLVRTYPCFVKLETGVAGQITVYDIGSEYLEEIQQFRETGVYTTASFTAGLLQSTTTIAHSSTSTLTIPQDAEHIDPTLYCYDCRAKIAAVIDETDITEVGYVLADMHDLTDIRIYPVADGSEYEIQGYAVKISQDREHKKLLASVTGYFD